MPRASYQNKASKELRQEQLAYCEEMMIRLRDGAKVTKACVEKYLVNPRTVTAWMHEVRNRRRHANANIDHEEARDDVRATLNVVVAIALGKTTLARNKDGDVALDGNGNPIRVAAPDLQRATTALRDLVDLDGLNKPGEVKVTVDGEVSVMPDLKTLGPDVAVAIQGLLKTLAPDADVAKLAGEWFKFDGESEK